MRSSGCMRESRCPVQPPTRCDLRSHSRGFTPKYRKGMKNARSSAYKRRCCKAPRLAKFLQTFTCFGNNNVTLHRRNGMPRFAIFPDRASPIRLAQTWMLSGRDEGKVNEQMRCSRSKGGVTNRHSSDDATSQIVF